MPEIIYSLVARGSIVLAEFTKTGGNFPAFTRDLLAKTENEDCQKSYIDGKYKFDYEISHGITYLALCDEDMKQRISFKFVSDIKERFVATYGDRAQTAIAFAMNDDFGRVLKQRMEFFNNKETDELSKVQSQIDDVKEVMVQNIDKIIGRGEKIEMLVQKSEGLNDSALEFQKTSKKLKNAMWWKNIKMMLIIGAVVLVIILILLMVVCSPNFEKCK